LFLIKGNIGLANGTFLHQSYGRNDKFMASVSKDKSANLISFFNQPIDFANPNNQFGYGIPNFALALNQYLKFITQMNL
jgi:hypothetical protein